MLAVGDNELDVGDNDDASPEVGLSRLAGSGLPRVLGICREFIFVFYSKKKIE